MTWPEEFGGRIRAARRAAKLTLEQAGAAVGCHRQSIHRWEGGQQLPSAETLAALCRAYGVSADWVLGLAARSEPEKS